MLIRNIATAFGILAGIGSSLPAGAAGDTFAPYAKDAVPQSVVELWKDYDARAEALEVHVVKEWKKDGVVTRYVTFKVGRFKGADARIAAYYCFPDNGKKNPAFVWCHGGGQRADRSNGEYFARQGFATIDINWLGREMEAGIEENTDWGNVDPTQGPKFYSKAKREHWYRSLQPDAYSIDTVLSPRNNNWFLLVVAARRAITFLEQQPEVNSERIGISGFSMGGTITAMTAMDSRIKAAVPFVGGTGFLHVEFPGGGGSIGVHYRGPGELDLYGKTVDPAAYWPHVKAPVMFLSSVNDFHAAFDRIFPSMALLPHTAWRVSANIHQNHSPSPEQWILLIKWFNLHLKRVDQQIPLTPPSTLAVDGNTAVFTVTPEDRHGRLIGTEIYYSYDPNPLTRFWIRADAEPLPGGNGSRTALTVHENLPLYVFALCRYRLSEAEDVKNGQTETFSLCSLEQSIVPQTVQLDALDALARTHVLDDFSRGLQDWAVQAGGNITTYKFQSPALDRSNEQKLKIALDPKGRKLRVNLRTDSRFLGRGLDLGGFSFTRVIEGNGPVDLVLDRSDFKGEKDVPLEWSRISRFFLSLFDVNTKASIDLETDEGRSVLKSISLER